MDVAALGDIDRRSVAPSQSIRASPVRINPMSVTHRWGIGHLRRVCGFFGLPKSCLSGVRDSSRPGNPQAMLRDSRRSPRLPQKTIELATSAEMSWDFQKIVRFQVDRGATQTYPNFEFCSDWRSTNRDNNLFIALVGQGGQICGPVRS